MKTVVVFESPLRAACDIVAERNIAFAQTMISEVLLGKGAKLRRFNPVLAKEGQDETYLWAVSNQILEGYPFEVAPDIVWASHLAVPPMLNAPRNDSDELKRQYGLALHSSMLDALYAYSERFYVVFGVGTEKISKGMQHAFHHYDKLDVKKRIEFYYMNSF